MVFESESVLKCEKKGKRKREGGPVGEERGRTDRHMGLPGVWKGRQC